MLEGNVCAAIHWLTKCSGGGVLKPSDSATYLGGTSINVLEVLDLKHPDPCTPPDLVWPSIDNLHFFEDSETTFYQLQGGTRPGASLNYPWLLICLILLFTVLNIWLDLLLVRRF